MFRVLSATERALPRAGRRGSDSGGHCPSIWTRPLAMDKLINLNADIAEGWGAYEIGNDAALLDIVTSANVACGFHGGDANTMHRIVMLAKQRGVSIGAHPGFNDLWGFGRRPIRMNAAEL
jgi:UPF0271 protein